MNFREGIYKIKQKDMNHHKLKKKKVHLKKSAKYRENEWCMCG